MKHLSKVSRVPGVATTTTALSTLGIKLNGIIEILDRVSLAQRQSAWKTPFPVGGSTSTTTTTTTGTTTLPFL